MHLFIAVQLSGLCFVFIVFYKLRYFINKGFIQEIAILFDLSLACMLVQPFLLLLGL